MKQYDMLRLFALFIRDSKNGKRKQRNGNRIKSQTALNYEFTLKLLSQFQTSTAAPLRVRHMGGLGKKEHNKERTYWSKFAQHFTDFLYNQGLLDNTVGMHCKNIKAFFTYCQQHRSIDTGQYFKAINVPKEESTVVVLSLERVQFLLNNTHFREGLPVRLSVSLDMFLLGCTTGLRFSDLSTLRPSQLEKNQTGIYIVTTSQKTHTQTRVKLPPYAIEIIEKYRHKQRTLLPKISLNQFNKNLKCIFEQAGWTEEVQKLRSKKGVLKNIKTGEGKNYRFCDMASSHMMRKTAITTMLMMGMPEPLVRKISGHSPNSKEFYRYVKYAQTFVDEHTDKVFDQLIQK